MVKWLNSPIRNLYISPLETCNLNCRYCYTHKTKNILTNDQILKFINKLSLVKGKNGVAERDLFIDSVTLCGGEVFTLPNFPILVNQLLSQKIFVTIITNGTIDRLSEITDPNNCQLIVSLDGPQKVHDANRGNGNFDQTIKFIRHALDLKFPTEIFFLITKDSYPFRDSFDVFGLPKTYLTDRLGSLTSDQVLNIKQNYPTYPSPQFGCSVISLQSDGLVYGCCESSKPIAKISDPTTTIINNFSKSLTTCQNCKQFDAGNVFFRAQSSEVHTEGREHEKKSLPNQKKCFGCCDPTYLCGYISELKCHNCQETVSKLNKVPFLKGKVVRSTKGFNR